MGNNFSETRSSDVEDAKNLILKKLEAMDLQIKEIEASVKELKSYETENDKLHSNSCLSLQDKWVRQNTNPDGSVNDLGMSQSASRPLQSDYITITGPNH